MSNNRFDEKRKTYSDSNIYMNKEIAEYEKWGEEEILARTIALSRDICRIWPCPDIIQGKKTEIDSRTEFDITDEVDVTGRKPSLIELLGEEITIVSWRDFLQTTCKKMYEYDSQIFRSLLRHKDFMGKSRHIISETEEGMQKPYKIAEGVFIETNLSANDALNYAKLIIDKYDGVDEECSYKLKPIS